MKTVVYQGAEGSFSAIAARLALGADVHLVGKETFLAVYEALENNEAEIAVIPIENSLIGSIWENYDLMHEHPIQIIGEKVLKIEHCLLGIGDVEKLKRVYSHPKALDQCRAFFRKHSWIEPVVHYDTAGAAKMLAEKKDPEEGAIASRETAELYGLKILSEGIADNLENYTRFLLVARQGEEEPRDANKCTLLLTLSHTPGALSSALECFARHGINLTKLESRPIIGKPFEYLFFIDLQFESDQRVPLELALKSIQKMTQSCKVMGRYARDSGCHFNG